MCQPHPEATSHVLREECEVTFRTLQDKGNPATAQGEAWLPFQQQSPVNSILRFPGDGKAMQLLRQQCRELPWDSLQSFIEVH